MENILILDKDITWRNWIKTSLALSSVQAKVIEVTDERDIINVLSECRIAVILADMNNTLLSSKEFIQLVRDHSPTTRIVLFTTSVHTSLARQSSRMRLEPAHLMAKDEAVNGIGDFIGDLLAQETA